MSATPSPPGDTAAAPRIVETRIIVRGLALRAKSGPHERGDGRRPSLIADVALDVIGCSGPALDDTLNYEIIVRHAQAIAVSDPRPGLQDLAFLLASACLGDARVLRARVRVEERQAQASQATAGAEVTLGQPVAS